MHGLQSVSRCRRSLPTLSKHLTTPVFGKDVVYDCPNEKLMEQKKFMKVGLSLDTLRAYVEMIENEVSEFLKNDPSFRIFQMNDINEWGQFDVLKVTQEITILTAARTLQGKEVRGNMDTTFAQLFTDLDGGFTPVNFLFPNLPLASYRRRDRAQKKMAEFYIKIIQARKEGTSLVGWLVALFYPLLNIAFYRMTSMT
jgi:sterol 14-demethylase